ncbi:hypothetical protein R1sor_018893 [Riccia sorocarpa]|uniref:Uncharacterized protein n=1 Tax=Riccia sorocarpa TaxID=122646 RepID=A0ABD3IF37_9MARC
MAVGVYTPCKCGQLSTTRASLQQLFHLGSFFRVQALSKFDELHISSRLSTGRLDKYFCFKKSLATPSFVNYRNFVGLETVENVNGRSHRKWRKNAASRANAENEDKSSDSKDSAPSEPSESGKDEQRPKNLEGASEASTSDRNAPVNPPHQSWWQKLNFRWNWSWVRKGSSAVQPHEIGALVLQLSVVVLLMRLLRPGFPFPGPAGSNSSTEANVGTSYVSVSFSEFLQRVQRNEVKSVEIDGVHLTFSLRSQDASSVEQQQVVESQENEGHQLGQSELVQLARSTAPTKRILFTTTRPSDMTTPYAQMLDNGVDFGAPDKRSVRLINSFSIALLYVGLIAGLVGRFPIKFPQDVYPTHEVIFLLINRHTAVFDLRHVNLHGQGDECLQDMEYRSRNMNVDATIQMSDVAVLLMESDDSQ